MIRNSQYPLMTVAGSCSFIGEREVNWRKSLCTTYPQIQIVTKRWEFLIQSGALQDVSNRFFFRCSNQGCHVFCPCFILTSSLIPLQLCGDVSIHLCDREKLKPLFDYHLHYVLLPHQVLGIGNGDHYALLAI